MRAIIFRSIIKFLVTVNEVIVQRTVHHELKRTNRVRYSLKIVALTMRKVVHRIYIPFATCAMVRILDNTIDDWVSEMHIAMSHINLSS